MLRYQVADNSPTTSGAAKKEYENSWEFLKLKKKERVNLNNGMMFHFYADDSQIYFSFDSNTPELVTASRLGACVMSVTGCLLKRYLKLNSDKTKLLLIASQFCSKPQLSSLNVCGDQISPSVSIINVGVVFDSHMKFEGQVSSI